MLPAPNGSFEVRKTTPPSSDEVLITGSAYRYSSYRDLPVGKYRLAITKKGDAAPLKLFDVDLKQDSYFTILISPRGIEMFEDTEDVKATTGTLSIRNFFPGSTVAVQAGSNSVVDALPYGQSQQVTGLPLGRTRITVRAKITNGKPVETSAELDFKDGKRATALIIPDPYGRFRPRFTFDGKNQ